MGEESGEVERAYTSYSAMSTHRICNQRWNYKHIRKLEKAPTGSDVPVERDMGTWWHFLRAADSIDRGREYGSLKWIPEELFSVYGGPTLKPAGVTSAVANAWILADSWWAKQSQRVQLEWIERIGEGLIDRLSTLDKRWRAQHAEEIANERPLAVELKWERALPMPTGQRSASLVGYVDEVYLDVEHNLIVVRDHKLKKKLPQGFTALDDMMDSQLQFYAWGAHPIILDWGLGRSVQSIAYDRVRMTKATTPVLTAGGGLSKSVTDYDVDTYRAWVGEGIPWGTSGEYTKPRTGEPKPKFGTYTLDDAVVQKLSAPDEVSKWFQRTQKPLNQRLIRAHLKAAVDSCSDMQRTYERVTDTREAGRNLTTEACRFCDYQHLCRAEMIGGADGTYSLADMGLKVRRKSA